MQVFEIPVLHTLGLADETFELIARSSFDYMFDPDLDLAQWRCQWFLEHLRRNAGHRLDARYPLRRPVRPSRPPRLLGEDQGHWPDCADDGALPYNFKVECRRAAGASD